MRHENGQGIWLLVAACCCLLLVAAFYAVRYWLLIFFASVHAAVFAAAVSYACCSYCWLPLFAADCHCLLLAGWLLATGFLLAATAHYYSFLLLAARCCLLAAAARCCFLLLLLLLASVAAAAVSAVGSLLLWHYCMLASGFSFICILPLIQLKLCTLQPKHCKCHHEPCPEQVGHHSCSTC